MKKESSLKSHLTIKIHKLHGREGVGYSAVDLLPDQIVRPQQGVKTGPMPSAAPKGGVSTQKLEASTVLGKIYQRIWLCE